jgi:hypothetical protein
MKAIFKTLAFLAAGIFLIIGALVALVLANQNKLTSLVLDKINSGHQGYLQVKQTQIAPFKNFPYISIELDSIQFFETKEMEGLPIYRFNEGYIGFDIVELIKGNYTIRKIVLENGLVNFIKYEDGTINLIKAKLTEDDGDDSPLNFSLKELLVDNVRFIKTDLQNNQYTEVLIEKGKTRLEFKDNLIDMGIDCKGILVDFKSHNESFFKDKHIHISSEVHYNQEDAFLKIDTSTLALENTIFKFIGSVGDVTDSIICDIGLYGKKSNFDLILSFAPNEYAEKLKQYKNEGNIFMSGKISGPSGNGLTPLIELEFGCSNAHFLSPADSKVKHELKDINFQGYFTNGTGRSLETSELSIRNLSLNPDNSMFKGSFRMRNFLNPLLFVDIHTSLDLEVLASFYPMQGVEKLNGKLTIDMTLDELVDPDSTIVVLSKLKDGSDSRIIFEDVFLKLKNHPHAVKNINGEIDMIGDKLEIAYFNAKMNKNDIALEGKLTNVMALFHNVPAQLEFDLKGHSDKLAFKDLLAYDAEKAKEMDYTVKGLDFSVHFASNTTDLKNYHYIPESNLEINLLKFNLDKYPHLLHGIKGVINMNDSVLTLKSLTAKAGDNDLYITAGIHNVEALFDENRKEKVSYDAIIKTKKMDIKQLMVYDGKSMLSDEIKEEVIKDFEFSGSGYFISHSFCPNGFMSETNINQLKVKLNDFPLIHNVKGKIKSKPNGSVYITDFYGKMGNSDLYADLELEHYLDSNLVNKNIKGKIRSNLIDLDEILKYNPAKDDKTHHDSVFNIFALDFPEMELKLDLKKFVHHKYLIQDISGKIRSNKEHYIYLDGLKLKAAGGSLDMNGYLNGSDKNNIYFSSTINVDEVDVNQMFYKFDNFGQDYMLKENIQGLISAKIKSIVKLHTDFTVDLAQSSATAELTARDGKLINFSPFHALADYFGDKNLDNVRFGELSNTFELKNGILSFPAMKLSSTLGYFYISGNQDMKMNLDYEVKIPLNLIRQAGWSAAKSKFKKKDLDEKELQEKEEEIVDKQTGILKKYVTFTIHGDSENIQVKMGKKKI